MNKLTPLAAGLALLSASGLYAAEPAALPDEGTTNAQASEPDETETNRCLQQTGSRLKTSEDRPCTGAPGQVITREQLDRTGAVTLSDAIRRSSASVN